MLWTLLMVIVAIILYAVFNDAIHGPTVPKLAKRSPEILKEGETTRIWRNQRNEDMFLREWVSHTNPKALMFYFHGMNSHSGEIPSAYFFGNLSQSNIDIIALDQIGHGQTVKSEDDRQVVEDWDHFIQDSTALIHEIMLLPKYRSVPYFIFGHSMGGAISIITSLNITNQINACKGECGPKLTNFKGPILLAPAIIQSISKNWLKIALLEFALKIGGPSVGRLALGPGPNPRGFDSVDHYELYLTDPYVYVGNVKVGFGYHVLNMMSYIENNLPLITFPFFVIHGDADGAIPLESSQKLMSESSTKIEDKRLSIHKDKKHNPLISNLQICLDETEQWIDERIKKEQF